MVSCRQDIFGFITQEQTEQREIRDLSGYLSHAKALPQQVSLILIPHSVGTVHLPADLSAKSAFVGQVVRQPKPTKYHGREPAAPRVVISGGGGGYPGTVNFYNLAMEGMAALREYYPALCAELITGPLFRDWTSLRLASDIVVVPFEPDITSRFSAADLVICQAGYNTVAELETLGTKALLVPAERQWDDQFARANRVASRRNNFHVFTERTPAELAHRAMEVLREQIPNAERAEADGGTKAAHLIYKMLG